MDSSRAEPSDADFNDLDFFAAVMAGQPDQRFLLPPAPVATGLAGAAFTPALRGFPFSEGRK